MEVKLVLEYLDLVNGDVVKFTFEALDTLIDRIKMIVYQQGSSISY